VQSPSAAETLGVWSERMLSMKWANSTKPKRDADFQDSKGFTGSVFGQGFHGFFTAAN
jgi:hypothetical protein